MRRGGDALFSVRRGGDGRGGGVMMYPIIGISHIELMCFAITKVLYAQVKGVGCRHYPVGIYRAG